MINQSGEGTPGVTGWFEVSVDGKLVHSKKVIYFRCHSMCIWCGVVLCSSVIVNFYLKINLVYVSDVVLLQNGDGYVDSEAKMKKIIESIAAAIGSKWCCIPVMILLALYTMVCMTLCTS